ncbi:MAG: RNA-binding protein [Psychromonas sp.]
MKLLVRNLATATTEEKLRSLFEEHGTVQSCNLVPDQKTGISKGFGFVEMPKVGEAKAAMKILNGYKLAGNFIRVKKAESKAPATEETQTVKPAKKEKPIKTASKAEAEAAVEIQSNENNALNIYGKIKQSDD